MERKLDLDQLINALVEARDKGKIVTDFEYRLGEMHKQEASLQSSIATLARTHEAAQTQAAQTMASLQAKHEAAMAAWQHDEATAQRQHDEMLAGWRQRIQELEQTHAKTLAALTAEEQAVTQRVHLAKDVLHNLEEAVAAARQQARRLGQMAANG